MAQPETGELYQHFKGGLYQILCLATNEADRNQRLVIYQNVWDNTIWSRPLDVFMSKVDDVKYPEYKDTQRMRLVPPNFLCDRGSDGLSK